MKLYKVITKASRGSPRGVPSEFVDWYTCDTEKEARDCWAEDLHRYGLPEDAQGQFIECDPATLEPLPWPPRETVEELADRFSAIIRAWLSPAELFAVRQHGTHTPECKTHEFCDPNQAMLYAWEGCFGRGDSPAFICEGNGDECDPVVVRHERLVDHAWTLARKLGFRKVPCVS